MKIKFGAIVTDGRGKLGGHVFSKNKAGAYIRTKVTPSNPQTSRQTTVRALFGAISQQWSGLTQAVRDGFNEAVPSWSKTDIFGDIKNPSGKALFQRLNNQAQVVGFPAVAAVPEKQELPVDVITAITVNDTTGTITATGASTDSAFKTVIYATAPLTAGTSFVKNRLRQIYAVDADAYVAADAYQAYEDKYGVPAIGANIYMGVKYVADNGQATPMQVLQSPVVA